MGLAGLDGHKEQSALNYGTVEMGIWETTSSMLKRDRKTKMPKTHCQCGQTTLLLVQLQEKMSVEWQRVTDDVGHADNKRQTARGVVED